MFIICTIVHSHVLTYVRTDARCHRCVRRLSRSRRNAYEAIKTHPQYYFEVTSK
jgi:hypothetical protein